MSSRRICFALATILPAVVSLAAERAETPAGMVVHSRGGVVVSQHPLATQVGVHVLERGGNAVDAAVATAFALAVVEPTNSGIGGRAQILIRQPDGKLTALDGTSEVPASYPPDLELPRELKSGYEMIGVPGLVAALAEAHKRHGSMPLETLVAPAVALAERGFPLSVSEAEVIARVADDLSQWEGSRRYFLSADGKPPRAGDRLVQKDLAATLQAIGKGGADVFYRGEIARRIVADMEAHGGYVTLADLDGYRVKDALVSRTTYRGHTVIGPYLPAGGSNLQEMLELLELAMPTPIQEPVTWAIVVAQIQELAFEDRQIDLAEAGPPETFPRPERLKWLLSPERLRMLSYTVRLTGPFEFESVPGVLPSHTSDGNTSHVSIVDREGRAVSLTLSVGPSMGARVATPGLGFVYAATMGYLSGEGRKAGVESMSPGDRASSRQAPTIILDRNGKLEMVLGASGSRKILSSLFQTVSHVIDHGMPLEEAVAAPRLHVEPKLARYGFLILEADERFAWPDSEVTQFRLLGFKVGPREPILGEICGIHIDPATGIRTGVADPRGSGSAASDGDVSQTAVSGTGIAGHE